MTHAGSLSAEASSTAKNAIFGFVDIAVTFLQTKFDYPLRSLICGGEMG